MMDKIQIETLRHERLEHKRLESDKEKICSACEMHNKIHEHHSKDMHIKGINLQNKLDFDELDEI